MTKFLDIYKIVLSIFGLFYIVLNDSLLLRFFNTEANAILFGKILLALYVISLAYTIWTFYKERRSGIILDIILTVIVMIFIYSKI